MWNAFLSTANEAATAPIGNIGWFWLAFGFAGQAAFTARFLIQWIASERRGESCIPIAFWYMSLVGSLMILIYAIMRRDPVIILGQSTGSFIYVRNLILIYRKRTEKPDASETAPAKTPSETGDATDE